MDVLTRPGKADAHSPIVERAAVPFGHKPQLDECRVDQVPHLIVQLLLDLVVSHERAAGLRQTVSHPHVHVLDDLVEATPIDSHAITTITRFETT
ncbi:hypothetical protein GCM10028798_35180 [Humibacter antri]